MQETLRQRQWRRRSPFYASATMPPKPKLSSVAPDTLHNIVTRGIAAVLGMGVLTVLLDPGSVKSYSNEVEYAKARGEELRGTKPHRCNDRLEDFIQAVAGEEGSIVRDFMPTARLFGKCMLSKEGQEPTDPYVILGPWSPCYIDPRIRHQNRQGVSPVSSQ